MQDFGRKVLGPAPAIPAKTRIQKGEMAVPPDTLDSISALYKASPDELRSLQEQLGIVKPENT